MEPKNPKIHAKISSSIKKSNLPSKWRQKNRKSLKFQKVGKIEGSILCVASTLMLVATKKGKQFGPNRW